MGAIKDIISAMLFDATVEEKAKFARISYRIMVSVFMAWALGMFTFAGFQGFATEADVEQKRSEALKPIQADLGDLKEGVKAIRTDQLGAKLRDLRQMWCAATDHDAKSRLASEIDKTQLEYKKLVGDRYPFEACL